MAAQVKKEDGGFRVYDGTRVLGTYFGPGAEREAMQLARAHVEEQIRERKAREASTGEQEWN